MTGYSICWLPVRLDCDHMFCIRCMIKMQNRNRELCPLCRAKTVLSATEGKGIYQLHPGTIIVRMSLTCFALANHSPHRLEIDVLYGKVVP